MLGRINPRTRVYYLKSDSPYYVSDQKRAANFMNMIMIKNALNNQ